MNNKQQKPTEKTSAEIFEYNVEMVFRNIM